MAGAKDDAAAPQAAPGIIFQGGDPAKIESYKTPLGTVPDIKNFDWRKLRRPPADKAAQLVQPKNDVGEFHSLVDRFARTVPNFVSETLGAASVLTGLDAPAMESTLRGYKAIDAGADPNAAAQAAMPDSPTLSFAVGGGDLQRARDQIVAPDMARYAAAAPKDRIAIRNGLENKLFKEDPRNSGLGQAAEAFKQAGEETFPVSQKSEEAKGARGLLTRDAPNLASGLLTFMIPGGAAGKLGEAFGLTKEAVTLASRTGSVTGAVALMGESGFHDALEKGATMEQAYAAMIPNAMTGLITHLGLVRALDRLDEASGGYVRNAIQKATGAALVRAMGRPAAETASKFAGVSIAQTIDGSATMAALQVTQDLIAKGIYDPKRDTIQNLKDSAAAGGIVNAVMGLIIGGIAHTRMRAFNSQMDQMHDAMNTIASDPAAAQAGRALNAGLLMPSEASKQITSRPIYAKALRAELALGTPLDKAIATARSASLEDGHTAGDFDAEDVGGKFAAEQASQGILTAPQELLDASPEFQTLLKQGYDARTAKRELAKKSLFSSEALLGADGERVVERAAEVKKTFPELAGVGDTAAVVTANALGLDPAAKRAPPKPAAPQAAAPAPEVPKPAAPSGDVDFSTAAAEVMRRQGEGEKVKIESLGKDKYRIVSSEPPVEPKQKALAPEKAMSEWAARREAGQDVVLHPHPDGKGLIFAHPGQTAEQALAEPPPTLKEFTEAKEPKAKSAGKGATSAVAPEKKPAAEKSLDAKLDELEVERNDIRDSRHAAGDKTAVKRGSLEEAMGAAVSALWSHDDAKKAVDVAKEHGRQDLVDALVERSERTAKDSQHKADVERNRPDADGDTPEFRDRVNKAMKKRAEEARAEADELRKHSEAAKKEPAKPPEKKPVAKKPVVEPTTAHELAQQSLKNMRRTIIKLGGITQKEMPDITGEGRTVDGKTHTKAGGWARRLFTKNGVELDRLREALISTGHFESETGDVTGDMDKIRDLVRATVEGKAEATMTPADAMRHAEMLAQERQDMDAAHDEHVAADEEPVSDEHQKLVAKATAIDEGAVERASTQHENDDAAFEAELRRIIDDHEKSGEAGAEIPETPARAEGEGEAERPPSEAPAEADQPSGERPGGAGEPAVGGERAGVEPGVDTEPTTSEQARNRVAMVMRELQKHERVVRNDPADGFTPEQVAESKKLIPKLKEESESLREMMRRLEQEEGRLDLTAQTEESRQKEEAEAQQRAEAEAEKAAKEREEFEKEAARKRIEADREKPLELTPPPGGGQQAGLDLSGERAETPPKKEAKAKAAPPDPEARTAHKDVTRFLVGDTDVLAAVGKTEAEFKAAAIEKMQQWLKEQRATTDGKRKLALASIDPENMYAGFWPHLKALTQKMAERLKRQNRDPEAYRAAVAQAVMDAKIDSTHAEAVTQFKHGFDHALKGKSKSSLPYEGRYVDGYGAGLKFLRTKEGRAWFDGGKPEKAVGEGEILRRWWELHKSKIEQVTASDADQRIAEAVKSATSRGELFPIETVDGATPGLATYFEKLRRGVINTFEEYLTKRLGRYGKRTIEDMLTWPGTDPATWPPARDERINKLKEYAADYAEVLGKIHDAVKDAKSITEAAAGLEKLLFDVDRDENGAVTERTSNAYQKTDKVKGAFAEHSMFSFVGGWDFSQLKREEDKGPKDRNQSTPILRPRLDRIVKTGTDWRKGRDVTYKDMADTFGFASSHPGEYVQALKGQDHLNYAYDAFMDLAKFLGIKPKDISLGGTLHFTIGALGHGKHAAHYQPEHPTKSGGMVHVINLTATQGDGSVAHEWGHALDFHLRPKDPYSANGPKRKNAVRTPERQDKAVAGIVAGLTRWFDYEPTGVKEMVKRFLTGGNKFYPVPSNVTEAIEKARREGRKLDPIEIAAEHARYALETYYANRMPERSTKYKQEADKLGEGYWGNKEELFARAWESFIFDHMGHRSDYLVNDFVADGKVGPPIYRGKPYPEGAERERFAELMARFMKDLEWTETGPVVKPDSALARGEITGQLAAKELYKKDIAAALADLPKMVEEARAEIAGRKAAEDKRMADQANADAEARRLQQEKWDKEQSDRVKAREAIEAAEKQRIADLLAGDKGPPETPSSTDAGTVTDDEFDAQFDKDATEVEEQAQEKPLLKPIAEGGTDVPGTTEQTRQPTGVRGEPAAPEQESGGTPATGGGAERGPEVPGSAEPAVAGLGTAESAGGSTKAGAGDAGLRGSVGPGGELSEGVPDTGGLSGQPGATSGRGLAGSAGPEQGAAPDREHGGRLQPGEGAEQGRATGVEGTAPGERDFAAEAKKHGMTALEEAEKALLKLWSPGQLNMAVAFDPEKYKAAKPHFDASRKAIKELGGVLSDWNKHWFKKLGIGVKEYLRQFKNEVGLSQDLTTAAERAAMKPAEPAKPAEAAQPPVRKIENKTFEQYQPAKLTVEGAAKHPAVLVEGAAMASVSAPTFVYIPNLPPEAIKNISDAQLEAITMAGQAHDQMLRDGSTRRGAFIGDGTGVGKGREIAGAIIDNFGKGRLRALWISRASRLVKDAKRDFGDVMGIAHKNAPITALDEFGALDKIKLGKGKAVVFSSYALLRAADKKGAATAKASGKTDYFPRIDQLVDWLGPDFDGVIAFDEAHSMGSTIAFKGGPTPSLQAAAALALRQRLPKARILYVSATGATEVANLAYAERLGIWGEGTAFPNVHNFIEEVGKTISSMEIVARDLKQQGLYMARSISYDGIKYDRVEHKLDDGERANYDKLGDTWRGIRASMEQAMQVVGLTGPDGKPVSKEAGALVKKIRPLFWGYQLRFFNQALTAFQMPAIIDKVKADLEAGVSPVLQLVNTDEASQERQLERNGKAEAKGADEEFEESTELEDLNRSPTEIMEDFLNEHFPAFQYKREPHAKIPGAFTLVPVLDDKGNRVMNPAAKMLRDQMLAKLPDIVIPDGPLDILFQHFTPEQFGEITGRSRRIITRDGKKVIDVRSSKSVQEDSDAFMNDEKQGLVFSGAGGTGFSFQADLTKKNQRMRHHYVVQPGWSAQNCMQAFGRTHRSNQKQPPAYKLCTTDVPAQKRFVSVIARRLEQLGALATGQREAHTGTLFDVLDNMESQYGNAAARSLMEEMATGRFQLSDGTGGHDLLTDMGMERLIGETSGFPETSKLLNRLLLLPMKKQEEIFQRFEEKMISEIQKAKDDGSYDIGMDSVQHDGASVLSDQVIYEDPVTKAQTRFVEIEAKNKNVMHEFDDAKAFLESEKLAVAFVRNKVSGRIWMVADAGKTKNRQGVEVERVAQFGTGGLSYIDKRTMSTTNLVKLTEAEARGVWATENDDRPKFIPTQHNIVMGSILPIWDRVPGKAKAKRIQTDDGRVYLGRSVDAGDVTTLLRNFKINAGVAAMTPEAIFNKIMDGHTATLANGWQMRRVRLGDAKRVELDLKGHWLSASLQHELIGQGAKVERIKNEASGLDEERVFVPAHAVLSTLTKFRPVVSLEVEAPKKETMASEIFKTSEMVLGGKPVFVAKFKKMEPRDVFMTHLKRAKDAGGNFMSGLGFHFTTREARDKFAAGDAMFSQAGGGLGSSRAPMGAAPEGLRSGDVTEELERRLGAETLGKLSSRVEVVEHWWDLPAGARRADAVGVTHMGKVYLVARGLTYDTVLPVLVHELGGHVALRDMLGDRYDALTQQFDRLLAEGDPVAKHVAENMVPGDTEPRHVAEERLAYLLQHIEQNRTTNPQGLTAKARLLAAGVMSRIKAWVFTHVPGGTKLTLTPKDIATLGQMAIKRTTEQAMGKGNPEELGTSFFSLATAAGAQPPQTAQKTMDKVLDALTKMPTIANEKLLRGQYLGAVQIYNAKLAREAKTINARFDKLDQRAMARYMEAGGDQAVLQEWHDKTTDPALKKVYERALALSGEAKTVADSGAAMMEHMGQSAVDEGFMEHLLDNYFPHLGWERNSSKRRAAGNISAAVLRDKPTFSKERTYASFFAGEQAGETHKVDGDTYGFGLTSWLAAYHEARAARQYLKAIMGVKMPDGRDMVAVGGAGMPISDRGDGKQPGLFESSAQGDAPYLVKPNARPEDEFDYIHFDHPALRKWKWVGKTQDGRTILMQGPMLIHPDAKAGMTSLLGKSLIKTLGPTIPEKVPLIGGKKIGQAMLDAGGFIKGTILVGPFHQFHVGEHAVFHGVNPLNPDEIDWDHPDTQALVNHGLMLFSGKAMDEFGEGLTGGGLWHFIGDQIKKQGEKMNPENPFRNITDNADFLQRYGEYLFKDYIPRLKNAMALKALERAKGWYAKELASGELTMNQLFDNVASQANAAFGELNYKYAGRNPTLQDAARLLLLAPDFLEARMRFAGQAVRPGGREQQLALIKGALIMAVLAQTLNQLFGDGVDFSKPFTVTLGGQDYTPRSVVGDIAHAVTDPRGFVRHRLNPLWARPAWTALTQRNAYDEKMTAGETVKDIAKSWIPIPAQSLAKNDTGRQSTMAEILNAVLGTIGISNYEARSKFDKFIYQKHYEGRGDQSPEERAKSHRFSVAMRALNAGEKPDLTGFTWRQKQALMRSKGVTPQEAFFKQLPFTQKLEAWEQASPAERTKFHLKQDILNSDISNVMSGLDDDERSTINAKLQAIAKWQPEGAGK